MVNRFYYGSFIVTRQKFVFIFLSFYYIIVYTAYLFGYLQLENKAINYLIHQVAAIYLYANLFTFIIRERQFLIIPLTLHAAHNNYSVHEMSPVIRH